MKQKTLVMMADDYKSILYKHHGQDIADQFDTLMKKGRRIEAMKMLRHYGLIGAEKY